jgi:SAM-dependent methyltransferase
MATPSPDTRETERVLRLYEKEAHKYDRQMRFFDRLLFTGGREWVCGRAAGEVLEIGVGTGRNLPHYGAGVRLTGVELSPAMLEIARTRAHALGREVDLRVGDAQALEFGDQSFEFGDQSFDTVVCTLSLCTIPDDRAAVAEVRRVLRPGGRFLLLEHVRSPVLPVRLAQRLLDPLAVRFEADHLLREPLDHLRAAGFEVESLERSKIGIVERVAARKPTVTA